MTDSAGSSHGLYASGYALLSTQIVPTGTWSHVAVTKSGAASALYIDGASAQTFTASAAFLHATPGLDFRIASRVDTNGTGADGGFDGAIDEAAGTTTADLAGAASGTLVGGPKWITTTPF